MNVLIVSQNQDKIGLIEVLLTAHYNARIINVDSLEQALPFIQDELVQIIISDFKMKNDTINLNKVIDENHSPMAHIVLCPPKEILKAKKHFKFSPLISLLPWPNIDENIFLSAINRLVTILNRAKGIKTSQPNFATRTKSEKSSSTKSSQTEKSFQDEQKSQKTLPDFCQINAKYIIHKNCFTCDVYIKIRNDKYVKVFNKFEEYSEVELEKYSFKFE